MARSHSLRIVSSGTLFLTHTLTLPTHPTPNAVLRAQAVSRSRGGAASTCLSILAQFPAVQAMLVAPLGGNEEGKMIIRDLEHERVSIRFCKVWDNAGVPSAWVLHADDTGTRTVINNNPLPDITHEEFVSLLGPLLVPENYLNTSPPATSSTNLPRASLSTAPNLNSPAPMDWLHFEGRSVKTTLSNMLGLDGLARERKWRSHCVFSIDVGRKSRQGIEALIPHSDVIFLNKHYAKAHSPHYATSPRAFLLSYTTTAPPHALLVAHWGSEGAAVLSLPTREYFQSSGWVDATTTTSTAARSTPGSQPQSPHARGEAAQSVRSGSEFWAAGHYTESSGEFSAGQLSSLDPYSPVIPRVPIPPGTGRQRRGRGAAADDSDSDSDDTQMAAEPRAAPPLMSGGVGSPAAAAPDEAGAQDAFVAGMIFALSRRMLPGEPYTPSAVAARDGVAAGGGGFGGADGDRDRGRWRLEECLRFATELAGRKAARKGWEGLADDMTKAGWFEL